MIIIVNRFLQTYDISNSSFFLKKKSLPNVSGGRNLFAEPLLFTCRVDVTFNISKPTFSFTINPTVLTAVSSSSSVFLLFTREESFYTDRHYVSIKLNLVKVKLMSSRFIIASQLAKAAPAIVLMG